MVITLTECTVLDNRKDVFLDKILVHLYFYPGKIHYRNAVFSRTRGRPNLSIRRGPFLNQSEDVCFNIFSITSKL